MSEYQIPAEVLEDAEQAGVDAADALHGGFASRSAGCCYGYGYAKAAVQAAAPLIGAAAYRAGRKQAARDQELTAQSTHEVVQQRRGGAQVTEPMTSQRLNEIRAIHEAHGIYEALRMMEPDSPIEWSKADLARAAEITARYTARLEAELAAARQCIDAALILHGVGESCDCEGGSCDHADWCPICVDENGSQIRQADDPTVRALTGDGQDTP